jgi:hypothetical protein
VKTLALAAVGMLALAAPAFRTSAPPRREPPPAPLVALPAPPELSPTGYQLVLDFEVGGGRPYFDRFLARPSWPGAASGVTVGVGYDCGYNSAAVILSDWSELEERARLAETAGVTGQRARAIVGKYRDIRIGWDHAEEVFQRVSVAKFWQLCRRTWPGFDQLRPNAQWALLSLTFNRGASMAGPSRAEMRAIRALVPRRDYEGMARQLEVMVRVWSGRDIERAMRKRRFAEAALMRTR